MISLSDRTLLGKFLIEQKFIMEKQTHGQMMGVKLHLAVDAQSIYKVAVKYDSTGKCKHATMTGKYLGRLFLFPKV